MLNVGVIGCGGMGKDHIKRLTEKIQGAQVVAVSDVFEEGAKEAAKIAGSKGLYRRKRSDQRSRCRCSIYRITRICSYRIFTTGDRSRKESLL